MNINIELHKLRNLVLDYLKLKHVSGFRVGVNDTIAYDGYEVFTIRLECQRTGIEIEYEGKTTNEVMANFVTAFNTADLD